jgi:hypothetical protein
MSFKYKLLSLLAVVGVLVIIPVAAQDDGEVVGGDEAGLRHFISFLTNTFQAPDSPAPTVHVGEVLPEPLFQVPLVEDATVIGSIDYVEDGMLYSQPDQILYETALSPQEVVTFYNENLGDTFSIPSSFAPPPGGGFMPENTTQYTQFCYNEGDGALFINAMPFDGGTRVNLNLGDAESAQYICSTEMMEDTRFPDAFQMLPKLSAPDGVRVVAGYGEPIGGGGGGGGSSVEASSNATLISDTMGAQDLLAYYLEEVSGEGWTIDSTTTVEEGGWLSITRTEDDKLWGGMITIIKDPTAENEFNAYVAVYLGE